MQKLIPEPGWPRSWIESHEYDREEAFRPRTNWGYAYAYANRRNETLKLITEAVRPGEHPSGREGLVMNHKKFRQLYRETAQASVGAQSVPGVQFHCRPT